MWKIKLKDLSIKRDNMFSEWNYDPTKIEIDEKIETGHVEEKLK